MRLVGLQKSTLFLISQYCNELFLQNVLLSDMCASVYSVSKGILLQQFIKCLEHTENLTDLNCAHNET